jgi:hypothetical protein
MNEALTKAFQAVRMDASLGFVTYLCQSLGEGRSSPPNCGSIDGIRGMALQYMHLSSDHKQHVAKSPINFHRQGRGLMRFITH